MTVKEVFELRQQGHVEEAYESARRIFAVDKSAYASTAMFWTAVDVLRKRVDEGRLDEAQKIYLALERLLNDMDDKNGWMHDAIENCHKQIERRKKQEALMEEGPEHLQMGVWGEDLAAAFLREKGYVILERNWHSGHRDIDIIAQHDNCIVFVEVKTRRNRDFGEPESAIDYWKQKNLNRAINHYIKYRNIDLPCRFDVITVVGTIGSTMPEINHIEDFAL